MLFAANCTFGLEKVLKRELNELNIDVVKTNNGKVYFSGDIKTMIKANLYLRCADRVFICIDEFKAVDFDELFDRINQIEWEEYLDENSAFNVGSISIVNSKINSKRNSQRIIKKAIVERLKQVYKTNVLNENGAYFEIFVSINKDITEVFLNTSGDGLHKRGYRLNTVKAPLKETLAAGIIQLSSIRNKQVCDLFSGSGTIIIEAARMLKNIPSGIDRKFAFEKWDESYEFILNELKEEARENIISPDVKLLGNDISYNAIKISNENAKRAGVDDIAFFQKMDFRKFKSRKKNGVIITNPPYAMRIGEEKEVNKIYSDLRKVYEKLDNWRMFVLCGNENFERLFKKKADKNRKLFNGNMKCYLYQYFEKRERNG